MGGSSRGWLAATCALLLIAWQVAASTARDTLFLTRFDVEVLPVMAAAGAALSLVAVLPVSRWISRLGPTRFMQLAFAASAAALLGVWAIVDLAPGLAAVWLYLQVTSFGVFLVSGFWSVVNEWVDPRSSKRHVARIAAAATLGGLVGGLLAERAAALLTVGDFLPVLALLHVCCAALIPYLQPSRTGDAAEPVAAAPEPAARAVFSRPYLRHLALLVVLLAATAGIVDYVFKAAADAAYEGEELMRFFAWFHMAVAVASLSLQSLLTGPLLRRLGVGRVLSLLPGFVAISGLGALLLPGLASTVALRFADASLYNTTHRSAWELLFVPLGRREKRGTKSIIDVGFARLGDLAGGLAVAAMLHAGASGEVMLWVVVALSLVAMRVAALLGRGYLRARREAPEPRPGRVGRLDRVYGRCSPTMS